MIDPEIVDVESVSSTTTRMQFGCGNVYLIADEAGGKLLRIFLKKGHTGLCVQALLEAIGRLLTIMVQQTDLDMHRVWKTLVGITCDGGSPFGSGKSCMDGVARVLREMYPRRFDPSYDFDELCAPTD